MRLADAVLLVSCLFLMEFGETSSVKLSIFGGGLAVGITRALRNSSKRNDDESLVLVRPPSAGEPEVASDYLADYNSETRFDYNYDFDPIDLNYSYDYDTVAGSGSNASEIDANIANAQLNPDELSFRDQPIPDFSDTSGGTVGSPSQLTQPDYDANVGFDEVVRVDDTFSSTTDGFTTRPETGGQKIDPKDQFNRTVPDYSSNPVLAEPEIAPINLQEIFSGIILFSTEGPQPIYESIVSNVDNPETRIENPEYIPDLESEDTFNPKYGLENIQEPSVISRTDRTRATKTTIIVPTTTFAPPTFNVQQPVAQSGTAPIERAKLLAWYTIRSPLGQPTTHFVVRSGKNLQTSASKDFEGAPSKLASNSPASSSSHLVRGKTLENILSPTAGERKTLTPTLRAKRKVGSRLPSIVQQKLTLPGLSNVPTRTNPGGIMQRTPTSRASVSSVAAHQKSTDGSSSGSMEQSMIPRTLISSPRSQQEFIKEMPSGTAQRRSMPRATGVSQRPLQRSSKGSQVSDVDHELISKTPASSFKIQHRLGYRPRSGVRRKSSQNESSEMQVRMKNILGGNLPHIRKKRTVIKRKPSKSKKLVDGYLPRGVGIDLRHRDRLQSESESRGRRKKEKR